jgi:hypothetical protein
MEVIESRRDFEPSGGDTVAGDIGGCLGTPLLAILLRKAEERKGVEFQR